MRDPSGTPTPSAAAAPGVRQPGRLEAPEGAARRAPNLFGRMMRFGLVGASGVLVNAALLFLLVEFGAVPVLVASLLSIELSTLSNWTLNRRLTWADRSKGWTSLGRYHAVAAVGMAVQWTALALFVAFTDVHYLAAALVGIAAATVWNFVGNERFAFARHDAKPIPRWAVYLFSGAVQVAIAALLMHPWDTFVFQRSVEDFLLRGQTPYQVAADAPAYTYWGGAIPAQPLWYAYPPLPLLLMVASDFPHALGWVAAPWAGRLLIRLPFIAATLGLAAVAHRLVRTAPHKDAAAAEAAARKAERWILLNPLFIVIAAIWGQFEALIVLLLALGVLAMRQQKWATAGAWWGVAVCVKIFPLYLAPLYAIHLVRRGGRKAVGRFAAAALAVGTVVNLPFFLSSPRGFLQQLLFMHGDRPPARLAPLAYLSRLLEMLSRSFPDHLPAAAVWDQWLGPLSFVLTAAIVAALAAASRRQPADEARLIEWSAYTLLGGLLATKVLNEQYLVMPLALLVIAHLHPQRTPGPGHGLVVWWGGVAVTLCGVLAGFNLLYTLPPALANAVLGGPAPEFVGRFAASLDLSPPQLRAILAWSTGLFLLVPCLVAMRRLAPHVRDGLAVLERAALGRLRQAGGAVAHPAKPVTFTLALVLLCATPLAVALIGGATDATDRTVDADGRLVLADYTTSWYNPAPDGRSATGSWAGVTEAPAAGFYNLNAHKVQGDLDAMQQAGIDGLVVQVHPYYTHKAILVLRVAEAEGMPSAVGVDLRALPGVAFDHDGARQVRGFLQHPLPERWETAQTLRSPDGRPLLFVDGVAALRPGFAPSELAFALESLRATQTVDDATLALAQQSPPASSADLLRSDANAATWRAAYAAGTARWWTLALDVGAIDLVLDDSVPGAARVAGDGAASQPAAFDTPAALRFTKVDVFDPGSVHAAFVHAFWTEAPAVRVPWNDFRAGRAAEPSARFSDATLIELATWTRIFHSGSMPGADDHAGDAEPNAGGPVPDLPPVTGPPREEIVNLA